MEELRGKERQAARGVDRTEERRDVEVRGFEVARQVAVDVVGDARQPAGDQPLGRQLEMVFQSVESVVLRVPEPAGSGGGGDAADRRRGREEDAEGMENGNVLRGDA